MRDFMAEFIAQPCVLVGNSVGSLVVLTVRCSGLGTTVAVHCCRAWTGVRIRPSGQAQRPAACRGGPPRADRCTPAQTAAREPEGRVAGTVLVNCAGGAMVALPCLPTCMAASWYSDNFAAFQPTHQRVITLLTQA